MRFEHQVRYDGPAGRVFEMLASEDFRVLVGEAQRATRTDVRVHREGDGLHVVVEQARPTQGVPAMAAKLVGEEIVIVQTETWSGRERGELELTVPGRPARFHGTTTLVDGAGGTLQRVTGEVRVSVPLIGSRLEALVTQVLTAALDKQEQVAREWLTG